MKSDRILAAVMAGVSFLAVTGAVSLNLIPRPRISISIENTSPGMYAAGGAVRNGRELALVYVGSSACVWSNVAYLAPTIQEIKSLLHSRADSLSLGFAAIGVAKDRMVADGLAHLEKFGQFDEVMTGRSWLNSGLQKFVISSHPGPAATPQLILLERYVDSGAGESIVESERVLLRKVGAEAIYAWLAQDLPIPLGSGQSSQAMIDSKSR
jgi:hypothetical protein